MVVFRWIVGSIAGLLLVSTILSYVLGLAFDARVWLDRGRKLRQYLWILALLWFNIEIWGSVVWTIVTWK